MLPKRSSRPYALLLWLAVLALGASVAFVPIRADNDCWWHVKSGLYILEHGLPSHDVFSYTAEDHKWDNHEWLAQVGMGLAWRLGEATGWGGWRAVIALTALVSVAAWVAVAWLVQRRIQHWQVALFIALWAIAIGRRTLYPRPPVLTYALLALFLLVLYEVRLRRWPLRRLWVLLPFTALWSNLHGGWMAGLAAIGVFATDAGVRAAIGAMALRSAPAESGGGGMVVGALASRFAHARREFVAMLLCLAGCVAASFCNPFGWRLYLLPGRVMKDPALLRLIGELQPPNLYFTVAFVAALVFVGVALALVPRRPIVLADLSLFVFWAWQASQHVRHLPMFAVAAAPLMAIALRQSVAAFATLPPLGGGLRPARLAPPMLAAGGLLLAVYVGLNPREGESYFARNRSLLAGTDVIRRNYPAEACDFALMAEIRGRLFNMNHYAGYLIWRLAPEHTKVFTDSRFDIFGGAFLHEEYTIADGVETRDEGPLWSARLDHWKVDWILIPADKGLNQRLSSRPTEWELVYRDGPWSRDPAGFVIWVRVTPETEAMRERCRRILAALGARAEGRVFQTQVVPVGSEAFSASGALGRGRQGQH